MGSISVTVRLDERGGIEINSTADDLLTVLKVLHRAERFILSQPPERPGIVRAAAADLPNGGE